MNDVQFSKLLLRQATEPFRRSGRFAYHYARGKLGQDPIFMAILRQGLLPRRGRFLDLGCGQGSFFAWLLAARDLYASGRWPAQWPEPPQPEQLRGLELMQNDVERWNKAFGSMHALARVEQGDMCKSAFTEVEAITILDALHYFNHEQQQQVLSRIYRALTPGGVFLTRIGDVSAGLPYRISNWVDHVVTFSRGHRLPQLYGRTLSDWRDQLEAIGFTVQAQKMSGSRPFANVMLVCRKTD